MSRSVFRRRWVVCLMALTLGGCALAWQPNDSPGTKAGKLAARIPLGAVTLGLSEVIIDRETAREAEWKAEQAKAERRNQLMKEADYWKAAAFAAKDESSRQLALTFFMAAREDLAALDGFRPPRRDEASAAAAPEGTKKQN